MTTKVTADAVLASPFVRTQDPVTGIVSEEKEIEIHRDAKGVPFVFLPAPHSCLSFKDYGKTWALAKDRVRFRFLTPEDKALFKQLVWITDEGCKVQLVPSEEEGEYRFEADLPDGSKFISKPFERKGSFGKAKVYYWYEIGEFL